MTDEITFTVSGASMDLMEGSELRQRPHLYNGHTSGIKAGNALNSAPSRRMGKGWSYTVTCDLEAAVVILDYCQTVGGLFAGESGIDQADVRKDGRALLATADRIDKALRATGWTNGV